MRARFDVLARALVLAAASTSTFAQDPTPAPGPTASPTPTAKPSKFKSAEDGWFDVSGFLDEKYGFVPIAVPITEPAIGLGGAGGLMFLGRPNQEPGRDAFSRPSITVAGGLGTENGTWGAFGADVRHWGNNRVQTIVAVVKASINLDFYGTGEVEVPDPLTYNLEPAGGMVQAKYRIGRSRAWVGLSYLFAQTGVSFDAPSGTPGIPDAPEEANIGGVTPSLTYDSRDSLFTANRGTYVEAGGAFYGSAFGGDDEFQKISLIAMQFIPLPRRLFLGLRADLGFTYGEAPFYMRPYVSLRGAPIARYQRDNLRQGEMELRWQFWKRLSLVGFAGHAVVWNDAESKDRKVSVTTGGGGVRYELARKYKLHMGADLAFGPDGPAFYIQVGSAWARP